MAAGLGFKTFTTGEVLTAADTNGYLMQGVLVFASAAARDAAITSPQEGQCCYLKDTDAVLTYSGAAWVGFDDSNAIQNSIVDAKGDLVAASGADTPARLAVGNNGETLVADSAATTGLRYQATPSASNPIINSGFDIWQRGTTFSNGATNTYTADRWTYGRSNNVAGQTVSRQATGDTTNLPNIQYSARSQRTSGNTSTEQCHLLYNFETADSIPFAGKTVTFSYYARRGANYSQTGNALDVVFNTGTGTDQNIWTGYTGTTTVLAASSTLTTTWQRFTHTFAIGSSATELAFYFRTTPIGTAGAADYFDLTGVQLDIGSVALPYRKTGVTLQGELAACQRYYYRWVAGSAYNFAGNGMANSTTVAPMIFKYPTTMRIAPTVIDFANMSTNDTATVTAISALALTYAGVDSSQLTATVASGLTANRPYFLAANNNVAAFVGVSAEL
jgi:hypothetical protein